MKTNKLLASVLIWGLAGSSITLGQVPAAAQKPASTWIGDARGCKVWDPTPVPGERVTWSGACRDGYADGPGTLVWIVDEKPVERFEGVLALGKATGHGVWLYDDGGRYEGQWLDGQRSGQGVYTWKNGARYEGGYVKGKRSGHGVFTSPSGERQEGEFVDGSLVAK